ncbi:MAG: hypothetical protein WCR55_06790 [Lentisphaerota bacterium]
MRKFKLIVALIIIIVLAVFLLQNLSETDIIFIIYTFKLKTAYLILSSVILGFLLGIIAVLALRRKNRTI